MDSEIIEIMRDIFNVEIDEDSNKQNIDEWDSFNHIEILDCIEKKYNIRFTDEEMGSINSFKDLSRMVNEKKKI